MIHALVVVFKITSAVVRRIFDSLAGNLNGKLDAAESAEKLVSALYSTLLDERTADENGVMIKRATRFIIKAQKSAQFRNPSFLDLVKASKGSYQIIRNLRKREDPAEAPSARESRA